MARRSWLCAALAVLPLVGCTTSSPEPTPTTSTRSALPRPALRLVAFESCDELGRVLRNAAKQHVTPWGVDGDDFRAIPETAARAMPADKAAPPAAPQPQTHSGTNVHEQGVDEPDIVKTDGRRIVTVSGGTLHVVDPVTRRQTGRLDLGSEVGGQAQLLLSGDRALVLISGGGYGLMERRIAGPISTRSEVLLVDLSGTPRVLSRYRGDGALVDARQNGSVARVVLSSGPKFTFPFRATTTDGMLQENRDVIGATPVDAWLPGWEITTGGKTTSGRLPCGAISRPSVFTGTAILRVLSFDLAGPALDDGAPVALVADGDSVYGTATSLYIANNQSRRFTSFPESASLAKPPEDTEIFRFELPPSGKPVHVASGKVAGELLNQYAMSEWDGHLRVATTTGGFGASAVRVLREQDGKLAEVGKVDGLGKGERIYSVRFVGPRAFVVTFRKTDPLYSLDLTDPARPRVTGELKITGYSAHLQPVGDNRLIGIGQEVRVNPQGTRVGTQVSLFDVADPARPRRLAQHLVKDGGSEAETDPHALLWWPATGLLVLPIWDTRSSGSLALRVTADGLQEVGRLAPAEASSPVRRSLVIGDVLWTMTDEGLLASNLSTLDRLGWVKLA
jgi:uncharacterized secreted protein with C-terminal beta-propeller domain